MKIERLVPDTSVIIEGVVSKHLKEGTLTAGEILIHEAMLAALEHLAGENKAVGFLGIEELQNIRRLADSFRLTFTGKRPSTIEMRSMSLGEIDSLVRELACERDGTLLTSDTVQAGIAQAKGIKCQLIKLDEGKVIRLERFFDGSTMSVHLRENVPPHAKKGKPGAWSFVTIDEQPLTQDDIQEIAREIIEEAKIRREGFIEMERPGSTIVQLDKFRIVITRPPFSDGWEITAVRPVKKLGITDYELSEKLEERIREQAEGILIAGAPGMGKSTFAAALAEFYAGRNKIVKTVEAPRDLVLPDTITQYAISHADAQEIHDILLLSRPDYTFFDEMRNTDDFRLFADLRLAGIGFIGVVHATNPIDAIQRFVGRIELGVIPQVVDTVVFIRDGIIHKVLSLRMIVKVPAGMTEADLARPVVVVTDFETRKPEYELYSYGEDTVVVPVTQEKRSAAHELAERQIRTELEHYSSDLRVEMTSESACTVYLPEDRIGKMIGRKGETITNLEKKLGLHIDVRPLVQPVTDMRTDQVFEVKFIGKSIVFSLSPDLVNRDMSILVNDDYLLTAKVSKKGVIKVKKGNKIGKIISDAVNMGERIRLIG
jgi:ATPase